MERLDLFTTPLQGVNLIEASAGTGKTYTISGLYLRLIVEQQLPVERILVVTYTKAATAELRERIRKLLVTLRSALESGASKDPLCQQFLETIEQREPVLKRVNLAILSFDRAAIFTIHGFCQRALSDAAFEGGMPFQTEMVTDDRDLLVEIVDDFWRRSIQDLPPTLLGYFADRKVTPDSLLNGLRGSLGKPYLQIRRRPMPHDFNTLEASCQQLSQALAHSWETSREEVSRAIIEAVEQGQLNRRSYPEAAVAGWLRELDAFISGGLKGAWFSHFDRFTRSKLTKVTNRGKQTPDHPFFDLCDQLLASRQALDEQCEAARVATVGELIDYANTELRRRKIERRVQSYDDLLLNLADALMGERSERLAATLGDRYRAALIDEFQDTDLIQYRIFQQLFASGDHSLFLVGDPKQAIYSFRGADIFAYLKAKGSSPHCYTLDTNWRSSPGLIAAVNNLFSQSAQSFLFEQITFSEVKPAPNAANQLRVEDDSSLPFRCCFIGGKLNKEEGSARAVEWTAAEIQQLLTAAGEGRATLGDRALQSGDIAVLVRSHGQGQQVADALGRRGIYSVQRSRENVFQSAAADDLERLLRAVAEPLRERLIPAALATGLFGVSSSEVERFSTEAERLDCWIERFQRYHQTWLQSGFMRMFRQLLSELEVTSRLLSYQGGERRLTDLLHLGELLHTAERDNAFGMEGLVKWLSVRRSGELPEDETHQLRLESDEKLIQIVTVHKSKGLQYPVVFAPFAWDSGVRTIKSGESYHFHDPESDYQAVLELGSEQWQQDQHYAYHEALAESLRLLYVALTRAEQRCYIHWGHIKGCDQSALGWLLHGSADPEVLKTPGQLKSDFKKIDSDAMLERLTHLAEQPDSHLMLSLASPEVQPMAADGGALPASAIQERSFLRRLSRRRQVSSFSALASGYHQAAERPDHDGVLSQPAPIDEPERGGGIFDFPRGPGPGSALHNIFEQLNFSGHTAATLTQLVGNSLERYAIDPKWVTVVEGMIGDVLATELEPATGIRLGQLELHQRLVELEFTYPVRRLGAAGLAALLQKHGFADSPEIGRAVSQLQFAQVEGYLKGYIDLIFEQGGRYHLLDYKSNWLGDSLSDYGQAQMSDAMAREGYFLQYLLYTLALHRYLRRRLPDYDYDRHMGRVFYLFLRGIDPSGSGTTGIYRARPERSLIEALDDYFSCAGAV